MSDTKPRGYFEQSRDLTNALILIAPLLLVYELGLLLTGFEGLNGVDFITILVYRQAGPKGILVFNLVVLAGVALAAYLRGEAKTFRAEIVPPLVVESVLWAFALAIAASVAVKTVLDHVPLGPPTGLSPLAALVASLGAGVNEELFFRLFLFQGLVWAIAGKDEKKQLAASVPAAVFSSLLFSAAHYRLGDLVSPSYLVAERASILYRFVAGLLFCGLFRLRGLAVAAYAHALYDVYVLVVLGR